MTYWHWVWSRNENFEIDQGLDKITRITMENSTETQNFTSEISDFNIIYNSPVQVFCFYLLLYFKLFEFEQ